ncbi:esterase FE4 [Cephus cinctus]|uniref:Carboxylic ester hydrolase n=1 Tax=Cephus cinctus TaxID=211228 RepID=A0A1W6L1D4_CEPCN|nr:esterase FE4 [Cephus cinctus]ARN17874.1 carboxylesterase 7 [Cephus cinctus]
MSAPIVKTKYGILKGTVVQNVEGGKYLAFNGIPYAEPPVGQLRFKEPQPPKAWSGIRDAQKEGSAAIQLNILSSTNEITGSEDCLYLNVSTNSLSGKRAVIVWIHGGGFWTGCGSNDFYGPDYLLKHDVVVVSINYRLHIFGFLNVDDKDAAGNQGLKDQVAALKWVQENIEVFGGDSRNVTICGQSAGSACVHYLTMSPLAKGLFHKAIGQSGCALNNWAYTTNNKEDVLHLVKILGLETTDTKKAVQLLQTVDAVTMLEALIKLVGGPAMMFSKIIFKPSLDEKSENCFLPQPPNEMAMKGIEVPSIIGYDSHEGILFLREATDETLSAVEKDFDELFDRLIFNQNLKKTDDIIKIVRKYYFGDDPITLAQFQNYLRITGDMRIVNGIRRLVGFQLEKRVPMYFYIFSAQVEKSWTKFWLKYSGEGTCHGEEIDCIFYNRAFSSKLEPNSKNRVSMNRLTRLWTNFAKTGDPTPNLDNVITKKWLPVTKQEVNYLEIKEDLITGVNPDQDKWQFLKSIYDSA